MTGRNKENINTYSIRKIIRGPIFGGNQRLNSSSPPTQSVQRPYDFYFHNKNAIWRADSFHIFRILSPNRRIRKDIYDND